MMARCKQCKATMPNHTFDQHDCPATVVPKDGESWEDYSARADKFAAQWQEKNLRGSVSDEEWIGGARWTQ